MQEGGEPEGGSSSWKRLELVLLDFGLAEELTPAVRHHFISFLHMIAKGAPRSGHQHCVHSPLLLLAVVAHATCGCARSAASVSTPECG